MATSAELIALVDALEKVRATGYARVTYEGRSVEYFIEFAFAPYAL